MSERNLNSGCEEGEGEELTEKLNSIKYTLASTGVKQPPFLDDKVRYMRTSFRFTEGFPAPRQLGRTPRHWKSTVAEARKIKH